MKKFGLMFLVFGLILSLCACDDVNSSEISDDTSYIVTNSTITDAIQYIKEDSDDVENVEDIENVEDNTVDITDNVEVADYIAEINIQDYGTIVVELDGKSAPITVANFVKLVNEGFYDGLTFHRIMEGFMMQGGDPEGTGMGGSDKTIVGEFSANGIANDISHVRGVISMARSQDYNSASSQFFIMHATNEGLDGQYAAFGRVIEGMEVVDAVCIGAEPTDNNGTIPPENQPVITSITVREK